MSEGFQVQNASYQAWIAPDSSIQQEYPSVVVGRDGTSVDRSDLASWVKLCRAGYVYVCYGPKSTMYLYGRPTDLLRVRLQWRALATAVERVRVTLVGNGQLDFIDTAEFPVPAAMDGLDSFIGEAA